MLFLIFDISYICLQLIVYILFFIFFLNETPKYFNLEPKLKTVLKQNWQLCPLTHAMFHVPESYVYIDGIPLQEVHIPMAWRIRCHISAVDSFVVRSVYVVGV